MVWAPIDAHQPKSYFQGTHRVGPPEQTWQRIQPLFDRIGITRVAVLTGLDDIGVPVCQAVRPDSRTLTVSQGKGISVAAARVSAAMEAIELWHAEHLDAAERVATAGEITPELGYAITDLPLARRHVLTAATRLDWTHASRLASGTATWVPSALLRLAARVSDIPAWPVFMVSSNGLASGNTLTEAVLHGLYEVIERDALAAATPVGDHPTHRILDLATVQGPAADLVEILRRARVAVEVAWLPTVADLPCFEARIISASYPNTAAGCGCHVDPDVALSRALTEACQSRLTAIAGTRDDIVRSGYRRVRTALATGSASLTGFAAAPTLDYTSLPPTSSTDLRRDLTHVLARLAARGYDPLVVDHTRPDVGVPVAHVVCPGLRFLPTATAQLGEGPT